MRIRIELGGNGHKPPDKSPPGQKTPRTKAPPDENPPAPDTQQAVTYSIAAVAGNWTILVWNFECCCQIQRHWSQNKPSMQSTFSLNFRRALISSDCCVLVMLRSVATQNAALRNNTPTLVRIQNTPQYTHVRLMKTWQTQACTMFA